MNSQKLEEVTSFKYLRATLCKDGTCCPHKDSLSNDSNGQTKQDMEVQQHQFSKFKLYKSLVTSILLCACEHGPRLLILKRRIHVFETKCMKKFPHISYLEHKTNNSKRTSSSNCKEMETCMVQAYHMP